MTAYVYNRTSMDSTGNGYTDIVVLRIKIPSTVNVYNDTTDVITLVRTFEDMDTAWDFVSGIQEQARTFISKEWYSVRFNTVVCEGLDF